MTEKVIWEMPLKAGLLDWRTAKMTKTKTVTLALALTALTGCEMVDPSNLFGQDYYNFGVGSPPNTQPFNSYPQSDGTSAVFKAGMNF